MAAIDSQSAWSDVTLQNDAIRDIHEVNPDPPYVISGGLEIQQHRLSFSENGTKQDNNSQQIQNRNVSLDPVHFTNSNHVTDDPYSVPDDTSILVQQEMTSSRQRRSRPVDHSLDSVDERRSIEGSSGSGTRHLCHEGQRNKIDKMARNQLIAVSILCTLFMIAEIIGGVLSNSLALVTDATHLASDLTSFLVSLLAIWLATKPPNHTLNYGYHRAEVLGALVSILIIWLVTGILVYMAAKRVMDDNYHIHANEMLIVASIGVGFNVVMGLVLHSGIVKKCHLPSSIGHNHSHGNHTRLDDSHHHSHGNHTRLDDSHHHSHGNHGNHTRHDDSHHGQHLRPSHNSQITSINGDIDYNTFTHLNPRMLPNLSQQHTDRINVSMAAGSDSMDTKVVAPKKNINIRAATIHVLGDFIQSIGVLIAAIVIKVKPEYKLADPLCTFLFSGLVLITTIMVLRDVILVLMEGKPRDIDYSTVYKDLSELDGVRSVHSLSLWSLTVNKTAASVHIAVDSGVDWGRKLDQTTVLLRHKHGVYTSTIQMEHFSNAMEECKLCQI